MAAARIARIAVPASAWLISAALAGMALLLYGSHGDPRPLLILSLAAGVVLLAVHCPVAVVAVILLLSTNCLQFFSLDRLPGLSVIAGVRLNLLDLALMLLSALGFGRLRRRAEQPLFLRPLLLFGSVACLSAILNVLAGGDASSITNGLRGLSWCLFYLGLAGVIDSRRRLQALTGALAAITLVAVAVQVGEVSLGSHLVLPDSLASLAVANTYYSTTYSVSVAGYDVPYLWNRATGYLLVALFLALGAALRQASPRHVLWAGLALLGFILALVRQWYAAIAVGAFVLLVVLPGRRIDKLRNLLVILLLLLVAAGVLSVGRSSRAPAVSSAWLNRVVTLADARGQQTFAVRLRVWATQLGVVKQAPLFGHGPGSQNSIALGEGSWTDVGFANTLVQYGLLGFATIGFLMVTVWHAARKLLKSGLPALEQGYVAGLLGLWAAITLAYGFSADFFTSGELTFAMALALALLDRFAAFATPAAVAAREPDVPGHGFGLAPGRRRDGA